MGKLWQDCAGEAEPGSGHTEMGRYGGLQTPGLTPGLKVPRSGRASILVGTVEGRRWPPLIPVPVASGGRTWSKARGGSVFSGTRGSGAPRESAQASSAERCGRFEIE